LTSSLPQILRTARAGSPARAWGLFVQGGWLEAAGDAKALTLKGRLLKDQAKSVSGAATGTDRLRLYGEAGEAYAASAKIEPGSYPLINAATLALLGGKGARAKALAQDVLNMLDENPLEAETPYWLAATRSEALLLLEQEAEARAALSDAIRKAPQAWEDHAATIGQFGLILSELGVDAGWLDRHLPPASLHFQGIMQLPADESGLRGKIDKWLAQKNIGFGYGALAAGADIVVAEALLARDAELHVILPCDKASFRAQSVAPFGGDWAGRFDVLIEKAETVDCFDAAAPCDQAVRLCEAACMGLVRNNARNLQSEARALRIDRDGVSGKQRLVDWADSGGKADILIAAAPDKMKSREKIMLCGDSAILLAIRHGKSPLGASPDGVIESHKLPGITILQFGSLQLARAAVKHIRNGSGGDHPMALDQGLVSGEIIESNLALRVAALAGVATEGQLLASKASAFPLLATHDDIRVEEAGEIRAAIGLFPAYAIISSS